METEFLWLAKALGLQVITGLRMLIDQAGAGLAVKELKSKNPRNSRRRIPQTIPGVLAVICSGALPEAHVSCR